MLSQLRRPMSKLKPRLTVVNVFRAIWLLVVWTCEVGVFRVSLSRSRCTWPTVFTNSQSPHDSDAYRSGLTHVLLIADPQLLDLNSYPDRPRWLQVLTQHIVDLNLRKNWRAVMSKMNPDLVIFLGDMMDNGRSVDDYEFTQYYKRFKSIFKFPRSIPVHYIPGNHDVGLGPSSDPLIKAHVRSRYLPKFGPFFNQDLQISNHTFLLIDAPALVDELATATEHGLEWSSVKGGTTEFLQSFYQTRSSDPIVLFSHIPLARSNFATGSCGPFRENVVRPILPGRGQSYQNLLPKEVTLYLLNDIRPSVIFSGDDHDYCDYQHALLDQSQVHEVSVRSFSMAMGVKRPGFQLLSIAPPLASNSSSQNSTPSTSSPLSPTASANFAYKPCLLPNQINIYAFQYGLSAFLTITVLCIWNYRKNERHRRSRLNLRTPFKLEPSDDDTELTAILYPPGSFSGALSSQSLNQRASSNANANSTSNSGLKKPNEMQGLMDDEEEFGNPSSSQVTLLPLHYTTKPHQTEPHHDQAFGEREQGQGHHIHHINHTVTYEPSRRRPLGRNRKKWYSHVLFDFIHISYPPLLFYTFLSFWYFHL